MLDQEPRNNDLQARISIVREALQKNLNEGLRTIEARTQQVISEGAQRSAALRERSEVALQQLDELGKDVRNLSADALRRLDTQLGALEQNAQTRASIAAGRLRAQLQILAAKIAQESAESKSDAAKRTDA